MASIIDKISNLVLLLLLLSNLTEIESARKKHRKKNSNYRKYNDDSVIKTLGKDSYYIPKQGYKIIRPVIDGSDVPDVTDGRDKIDPNNKNNKIVPSTYVELILEPLTRKGAKKLALRAYKIFKPKLTHNPVSDTCINYGNLKIGKYLTKKRKKMSTVDKVTYYLSIKNHKECPVLKCMARLVKNVFKTRQSEHLKVACRSTSLYFRKRSKYNNRLHNSRRRRT